MNETVWIESIIGTGDYDTVTPEALAILHPEEATR